jgi:hypothetical protein
MNKSLLSNKIYQPLILLLFVFIVSLPEKAISVTPVAYITRDENISGASEPGPYGDYLQHDTNNVMFFRVGRFYFPSNDNDWMEFTNAPLTVNFTAGGTAESVSGSSTNQPPCLVSTDYLIGNVIPVGPITVPQPGQTEYNIYSVVIPAGELEVQVPIWPVLDYACEGTESITLAIEADSAYYSTNEPVELEIYDTDTAFSFAGPISPFIKIYQGSNITCEVTRTCGCEIGTSLWNSYVTNVFALTGSAVYGSDYTLDSSLFHVMTNGYLYTIIPPSNHSITMNFTALTNNTFTGRKTVNFVPQSFYDGGYGCLQMYDSPDITIVATGTPILSSPTLTTNAGFQFSILGENNSLCYISASTNLVNWTNIGSLTLTNSTNVFIDSQASNFLNRFYRVYYTP